MHTGITAPGLTSTILTAGRPRCPVASYSISGVLSIGCSINVSVLKDKQQNYIIIIIIIIIFIY